MSHVDATGRLERWIRTACLMEATAPKPGNVHPRAAFADVTYQDFVKSADVAAPVIARAGEQGVGRAMLEAVRATQAAVRCNTNLGMIMLLAPLAAVPLERTLATGLPAVLRSLSVDDARHCYAAIRLASPGGLGTARTQDVADEPSVTLLEVMSLAAGRDRVAAQYASGFRDVIELGLPQLANSYDPSDWSKSVVRLHLELMAESPDTLIARKCGWDLARESSRRAQQVLGSGWPHTSASRIAMTDFDDWLRADGHRRNPGTTADLVAAILFAGLREGVIDVPAEFDDAPSCRLTP